MSGEVLVAVLKVLVGDGGVRDVDLVRAERGRLERFGNGGGEAVVERGLGEEWALVRSQWLYEGCERAVGKAHLVEKGVEVKGIEVKGAGSLEDGAVRRCSDDDLELPEILVEADGDDTEREISRGRNRTPRRATSAKRRFRGLENW